MEHTYVSCRTFRFSFHLATLFSKYEHITNVLTFLTSTVPNLPTIVRPLFIPRNAFGSFAERFVFVSHSSRHIRVRASVACETSSSIVRRRVVSTNRPTGRVYVFRTPVVNCSPASTLRTLFVDPSIIFTRVPFTGSVPERRPTIDRASRKTYENPFCRNSPFSKYQLVFIIPTFECRFRRFA